MGQNEKDEDAISVNIGGEEKEISLKDLCLSNQLNITTLMSLLIKKDIISQEEYMKELERFKDADQSGAAQIKNE